MEAVILMGIQGSGKSTFCKERLFDTHVRVNGDMLRTKNRERVLIEACLRAKQAFVVDKMNAGKAERERYIRAAKAAEFRVVGCYFSSKASESLERLAGRERKLTPRAVYGSASKLELPSLDEGFDELYFVSIVDGGFDIQEWRDEV